MPLTDPDRLFPADPATRSLAGALYEGVADLPILSPHGHCDPRWFAENDRFPNPAELFVIPDHYVFRMLVSQGIALTDLGVPRVDGGPTETDPRKIWRLFASNYHLFRATPSGMWLDHSFEHVFGVDERPSAANADAIYDHIDACLAQDDFRPRALFDRFNIDALATTEGALDGLKWAEEIGGLPTLMGRVQSNYEVVCNWVERTPWVDFLATDPAIRSCTSVTLKVVDPAFDKLSEDELRATLRRIPKMCEAEEAGYDFSEHKSAPPGFRIWCGATVETKDLEALFPWIEWAFHQIRAELAGEAA